MTPEENRKREQDAHVKFIKEHICDKNGDKSFVFISYKSDDWNVVLHDIVYTLVKDYGLNVYFDGSFDSHNSLWINQFPENMEFYKCKGVLAFFDDKYAASYATLLELMYSQKLLVKDGNMPVVPINLDKLTKIDDAIGAVDTGLGAEHFEDGTRNVNAAAEVSIFNETFNELTERGVLKKSRFLYKEGKKLTKKICSEIVAEMIAYLGVNENYYEAGKSLDAIVESIKDACGPDVFSELAKVEVRVSDDSTGNPDTGKDGKNSWTQTEDSVEKRDDTGSSGGITGPKPLTGDKKRGDSYETVEGKVRLPEFIKEYNQNIFKAGSFKHIRLVGVGEYEKYSTGQFETSTALVWNFAMERLRQMGTDYISLFEESKAKSKNPIFLTDDEMSERNEKSGSTYYRQVEVLKGYWMNSKYGPYGWINDSLQKQLNALGWPLESFYLRFDNEE